MDKRMIDGVPLPVTSVIQGATPLFGQTLVEEPHRLLDDVFPPASTLLTVASLMQTRTVHVIKGSGNGWPPEEFVKKSQLLAKAATLVLQIGLLHEFNLRMFLKTYLFLVTAWQLIRLIFGFSTGTMRAFLFLNLLMQFLLKSQKELFALGVSLTGLLPDFKKQ